MHNNVLQFDTEELFNYEELHYYDEDGQRGFLAYLIKTEEWKVIDNKIVFINIISEKEVHELIKKYDTEIMKENLRIKKGALETISLSNKNIKENIKEYIEENYFTTKYKKTEKINNKTRYKERGR